MGVCIIQLGSGTIFSTVELTEANEMQMESEKEKEMMGYIVIGTP